VAAVPFVDQVLLVDALGLVWRGVRDVIADGGQGQRQRGQSLLTVDDEPAGARSVVLRRWREHDRTEEVRARLLLLRLEQACLFQDVAPQLLEVLLGPGVRALVERYLDVLSPALHEIGEQCFLGLHMAPLILGRPPPITPGPTGLSYWKAP